MYRVSLTPMPLYNLYSIALTAACVSRCRTTSPLAARSVCRTWSPPWIFSPASLSLGWRYSMVLVYTLVYSRGCQYFCEVWGEGLECLVSLMSVPFHNDNFGFGLLIWIPMASGRHLRVLLVLFLALWWTGSGTAEPSESQPGGARLCESLPQLHLRLHL